MKAVLRPLHMTVLALALLPGTALAQRTLTADLQQQMSPEQFRAAGLDKLSAQELATLNGWLRGTVEQATAAVREQAIEEGRQEIIVKNRGFLTFDSNEPILARSAGPFPGFGKGRIFRLDNGQEWEQTDDTRLPGRPSTEPQLRISPGLLGVWYLQVDGFNTRAKVRRVK